MPRAPRWPAAAAGGRALLRHVFVIARGDHGRAQPRRDRGAADPRGAGDGAHARRPARPHAYATAHLANTASLLLPVSNLTNLLAFSAAGFSFTHFTAVMAPPWLAAVAVEYRVVALVFRAMTSRVAAGPGAVADAVARAGVRAGGARR